MFRLIWLCLAGFAAFTAAHVSAALPARPSGPILDAANVIAPADEAALDAKLRAYNQATGRAIIVATVPSLDGEDVEAYAQRLAESWGIGGKQSENGVLFLIAPSEHRLRVATARGLQDRLTDIMSGRIIRDVVVPHFKQGDMSGGIVAGTNAIITQLDMDPAQARAIEEAELAAQKNHHANPGPAIGLFFVFVFFFVFPVIGAMSRKGGKHSGFASAAGNIALWTALNVAANAGRGGGGGGGGWGGGGGGGFSGGGGGFGGFGGGGGGFNGGGASGGW